MLRSVDSTTWHFLRAFPDKNASIPLTNLIALDIPIQFGGALFTAAIFSWPDMGRLFFRQAQRLDYAVDGHHHDQHRASHHSQSLRGHHLRISRSAHSLFLRGRIDGSFTSSA